MKKRLYKEFQIIKWPFIIAALSFPFTFLITEDPELRWNIPIAIQLLCCAIMGSAIFGQEFEHSTMEKLLSYPLSRIRIWREKMLVLGFCTAGAALVNSINPEYYFPGTTHGNFLPNLQDLSYINERQNIFLNFIIPIGLGYLALLCSGIFMSLYIRKTHTAFWGALTSTLFIMILWQIVIPLGFSLLGISSMLYNEVYQTFDKNTNISLPLFLWSIAAYLLARKKFMKLEV